MSAEDIHIKGAREHNLQDVDLVLPRNQLVCFTGVSGSGKSSLAFDTLYAEGQRRYVESLSSHARHFLGQMAKPDVDLISGLSPSISIAQKTTSHNPRSTVGTITEIYDFLRVLYARVGVGYCPQCGEKITAQTRQQILARINSLPAETKILILAPKIRGQKGEYKDLFFDLLKQGFVRARVDGKVVHLGEDLNLDRQMRHTIDVVIDRLTISPETRGRLSEAVETALHVGNNAMIIAPEESSAESPEAFREMTLSSEYACGRCQISFEPPTPQLFSFNSPQGMCLECNGLGEVYTFDPQKLVPDETKTFQKNCVEALPAWGDLGRWRRVIYKGVAEYLERTYELPAGSVLETPWGKLPREVREKILYGTGTAHITFTWRSGPNGQKWGGTYEGIIPMLLAQYRSTNSRMMKRRLEKYMDVCRCGFCRGERLNPQARSMKIASESFAESDGSRDWSERSERNDRIAAAGDFPVQSGLPKIESVSAIQSGRSAPFHSAPVSAVTSWTLPEMCAQPIHDVIRFFTRLSLDATGATIAEDVLKEIRGRLGFLEDVGLEYLTLGRTSPTLSGGETQRIRLAGQIGCGLVGVLYILDEPSIGLHPRDNNRLLATLEQLRDLGNTVVVVEHDEDTMLAADRIVDFGPGAGIHGGKVVAKGGVEDILRAKQSVTGQFLSGRRKIAVPEKLRAGTGKSLIIRGASHNNLKHVDVEFPLGKFICMTGVSGSGKSSLVNGILRQLLNRELNRGLGVPGAFTGVEGLEHLNKMIAIDQSPIGRTPRSNPATYIKLFDEIRAMYAELPESRQRGFKPGRFSFNVEGGRCEACQGNGANKLEMDFLADVWVTCPVCHGRRFNHETLKVLFKGYSIADVLEMDVEKAGEVFENIPKVFQKLETLRAVGLNYMKLGQSSTTLSGGEAQRIKLARELTKISTGRTIYILDEPTTGLHFADIERLLDVLHRFADAGNTVLVVEHNLDVIKTADWVIDLGPEGGGAGGEIVMAGTPAEIAENPRSYTGVALRKVITREDDIQKRMAEARKEIAERRNHGKSAKSGKEKSASARNIHVECAHQHNLKQLTVDIPRDKMTICCGPSGSGKSSFAMDTIYAEGQRRYVESLSSYTRQFIGQMQKPKVERIEGLSPAIAIEQKRMSNSPRSTVGTVTEIYDYLRILFSRIGIPYCPDCHQKIGTQTTDEIIDRVMNYPAGTRLILLAPRQIPPGHKYEALWSELRQGGFLRVRIDGEIFSLDAVPDIDRRRKHDVEVIVDRVEIRTDRDSRGRIAESVEQALAIGSGTMRVLEADPEKAEPQWRQQTHSQHYACEHCGRSFEPLAPANFSFNNALGWCPVCEGIGVQMGANPAILLRDPKLSLRQGVISLWPGEGNPLAYAMMRAFCGEMEIPLDVPYEHLASRYRRILQRGTGERWFAVPGAKKNSPPMFKFQFKGLAPVVEEAARMVPSLRSRLESFLADAPCPECGGSRLRDDAAAVRMHGRTLDEICEMPLDAALEFFKNWKPTSTEQKIAGELIREVRNRLQFLVDVGLEYITLGRGAPTLSGGEMQRIRLTAQVGSGLCGVLYVLDEPTIGLHPRDNKRLIAALHRLRDLGNTLLVVEHDKDVIAGADRVIDFGPKAGRWGGEIVGEGTPKQLAKEKDSVTGPYLSGKKGIPIPRNRRMEPVLAQQPGTKRKRSDRIAPSDHSPLLSGHCASAPFPAAVQEWLEIIGARENNLKDILVRIPLGTLTAVAGVSGSGKSTLVDDILYAALARQLHRAGRNPGAYTAIRGIQFINKVIEVDQQPIGQTPSSNPATYTGVFDHIRELFAQLPESKLRGFTSRRFSFNVPGGRCEKCEGNGELKIEMHFLPDVWVTCDSCRGQRYDAETLAVRFHGYSIADVLNLTCAEALTLFQNVPKIRQILKTLCDVGLDYITLGQSAPTLSGGEAQRVKLAAELARPDTGRTLYLLDEPTTGLHFEDLTKLMGVLNRLVDLGNTVLIIEHNTDVLKVADWIIELGPEAGEKGGYVVMAGTPEDLVEHAKMAGSAAGKKTGMLCSHTGEILEPVLAAGPYETRKAADAQPEPSVSPEEISSEELIALDAKMPWETDGLRWHTQGRARGTTGVYDEKLGAPPTLSAVPQNTPTPVLTPAKWDARILEEAIRRVEKEDFLEIDWNDRNMIRVTGDKKSLGWFLHIRTCDEWLLKMNFRVAKGTFDAKELVRELNLRPLNEMTELPLYGTVSRTRVLEDRGAFQEIELKTHYWDEVNRPEFWAFLDRAVKGFQALMEQTEESPSDFKPWKTLGRKWHEMSKGTLTTGRRAWNVAVLQRIIGMIEKLAPNAEWGWTNKVVVPVTPEWDKTYWARIHTKKPDAVYLELRCPKNAFPQGRIAEYGFHAECDGRQPECDWLMFQFRTEKELEKGGFPEFLAEVFRKREKSL